MKDDNKLKNIIKELQEKNGTLRINYLEECRKNKELLDRIESICNNQDIYDSVKRNR